MSAATEILLEEIKNTTQALEMASSTGDQDEIFRLSEHLRDLRDRFNRANRVLNESRSVLKG